MGRKKIELICPKCGKTYLKDKSEHKRNLKVKRDSFCSYECASHLNGERFKKYYANGGKRHIFTKRLLDEYSPFRECLRRVKVRNKRGGTDLTIDYLKLLFESQNGICPYTGVKMTLINYKKRNDIISDMSLDRIDSSKGYVIGNVQFVVTFANYMKSTMSHDQMIEACKILTTYWRDKI